MYLIITTTNNYANTIQHVFCRFAVVPVELSSGGAGQGKRPVGAFQGDPTLPTLCSSFSIYVGVLSVGFAFVEMVGVLCKLFLIKLTFQFHMWFLL